MSGNETITGQRKNTSYGANEFRDGISYSEHEQKKLLIEPADLANLATGECYAFLPEPQVRIAKIGVPEILLAGKNNNFIAKSQIEDNRLQDTDTPSVINNSTVLPTSVPDFKIKNIRKAQSGKAKSKAQLNGKSMETI
jgi:hypothetical protein